MKKIYILLLIVNVLFLMACNSSEQGNTIEKYNISWDSPSIDCSGSMPLGNGDIGINAWVEENGDLFFYISKTDAWGDNSRLLKVGKLKVSLTPSPINSSGKFSQILELQNGSIEILFGEGNDATSILLWVDANNPAINVEVKSPEPVVVTTSIEMWRTEQHPIESISHGYIMFNKTKRAEGGLEYPVIIEPDILLKGQTGRIGWYHHNSKSVGPQFTAERQGLSSIMGPDPLLYRTFGAIVEAKNATRIDDKTLQTEKASSHYLNVHVLTEHPSSPDEWLSEMEKMIASTDSKSAKIKWEAHQQYWADFWNRSWIDISPQNISDTLEIEKTEAFNVSSGYTLQRFISACAGRGNYPIKFNGSIFNVAYPDKPEDADYRRWGNGYWWQNTRLPYISMCASGDFENMKPLFKFYIDDLMEFFKKRTKHYLGHDGLYITEEVYIWGGIPMNTYGWETTFDERKDKLQTSGFHKYEWVSGLELLFMMLDYYDYTQDHDFLNTKVLPFAHEVLTFFDQHYKTKEQGKMVMYPSQALETWWDCTNPMPELAGLHATTNRLLLLPEEVSTNKQRDFWTDMNSKLPEIPLREIDGIKMLAPAERYEDKHNKESPELYAVFPFRLFGVGKPNMKYGTEAMKNQWNPAVNGWSQEDIFYAYLGDANNAKKAIVRRSKGGDKNSRFPAFWGPNFDWTPDQDHGGVMMKAVQSLALQVDGEKMYLLPAWPKEWDVNFKLHAPYNTIVECEVKNGIIEYLNVIPEERKADIVFPENFRYSF
jgi:alpha-L-fucosidase 2